MCGYIIYTKYQALDEILNKLRNRSDTADPENESVTLKLCERLQN